MNHYFIGSNKIGKPSTLDIEVTKAEGEYLYSQSQKYLDLRSGLWNVNLGYNQSFYQEVKKEFEELLDKGLPYLDINAFSHPLYEKYAVQLLEFLECEKYRAVSFTTSGSEAVELSVKISHDLAKLLQKKANKIVIFKDSYHGTFFGSMTVSHHFNDAKDAYSLVNDIIVVNPPTNEEELILILKMLKDNSEEIVSFIMEPVVGSGGCKVIRDIYLDKIVACCNSVGILSIFDEISTGFYRTGEKFALTSLNNKPNIVLLSKSINNGILPFGAIIIDKKIHQLLTIKNVNHFSTQTGNLLGLVSAKVALEHFQDKQSVISANVKKLEEVINEYKINMGIEVNGKGAMYSVPLNDFYTSNQIMQSLKKIGILVYAYHNTDGSSGITIFPHLMLPEEKWSQGLQIIFDKVVKLNYGQSISSRV